MSNASKNYIWSETFCLLISGIYLVDLYLKNLTLNVRYKQLNFINRGFEQSLPFPNFEPNALIEISKALLLTILIILLFQENFFNDTPNMIKPNVKDNFLYYICLSINTILILTISLMLQDIIVMLCVFFGALIVVPFMIWG